MATSGTTTIGTIINQDNYEILEIETDYHKQKFIKSFHIYSLANVLNDKKSVYFPTFRRAEFHNWTFALEQPDGCAATSLGMLLL